MRVVQAEAVHERPAVRLQHVHQPPAVRAARVEVLHVRLAVVQRVGTDVKVARHYDVFARRRERLRPVLHRLQ